MPPPPTTPVPIAGTGAEQLEVPDYQELCTLLEEEAERRLVQRQLEAEEERRRQAQQEARVLERQAKEGQRLANWRWQNAAYWLMEQAPGASAAPQQPGQLQQPFAALAAGSPVRRASLLGQAFRLINA